MFIDKNTEKIPMLNIREHIECDCCECDRHSYCTLSDLIQCYRYYYVEMGGNNPEE